MSTTAPDPGSEPGRIEPGQATNDRQSSPDAPADQPGNVEFDPFRFGRPDPGSPAAAAFPHLFPPPPPAADPGSGPGAANPGWGASANPGWGPPPGSGYPPPAPGTGLGYPPPTGPPGSSAPGPGGPGAGPPPSYAYPGNEAGPSYRPPYGNAYPSPGGGDLPGNGKAVAGLVLGIASVVLFFFTLFDLIPIVLAFVFSIQGLRASREGKGQRGLAVAGIVLASVATVIVVAFVTFFAIRVNHCQQHHDEGTKSYNQCLIDL